MGLFYSPLLSLVLDLENNIDLLCLKFAYYFLLDIFIARTLLGARVFSNCVWHPPISSLNIHNLFPTPKPFKGTQANIAVGSLNLKNQMRWMFQNPNQLALETGRHCPVKTQTLLEFRLSGSYTLYFTFV